MQQQDDEHENVEVDDEFLRPPIDSVKSNRRVDTLNSCISVQSHDMDNIFRSGREEMAILEQPLRKEQRANRKLKLQT